MKSFAETNLKLKQFNSSDNLFLRVEERKKELLKHSRLCGWKFHIYSSYVLIIIASSVGTSATSTFG